MSTGRTARFAEGDHVCYRYGQVTFEGVVIASGYVRDVVTGQITSAADENLRYMVQQDGTGILHVYGPRHLEAKPISTYRTERPTIAELDAILNDPNPPDVTINPDGTITEHFKDHLS